MIKTKKKTISVDHSYTCDICGVTHEVSQPESEEFIIIRHNCGFFSVFGDMNNISLDMCQNCFKDKLGNYIRINT